ncbi:hypothetical protein GQX74_003376 [Glossina fuscipes]|nr:hypothetical protein GQX74_003376 [Glossina fuscipes]
MKIKLNEEKLILRKVINLGSPYLPNTPAGSESPLALHHNNCSSTKSFQLSQNSAFNLALRNTPGNFNAAFQAAVAAGFNGFHQPLSSPLPLYRFNERYEESSDFSSTTTTTVSSNEPRDNNMDLINPYMRHHNFAAAAAVSQSNSPAANLLQRSPPLPPHHQSHISNGFADGGQMDYQNRDHLLDYHSAAVAAYAANNNNNNNNNLSSPLMLLKNHNNDSSNNNYSSEKLHSESKSPRSTEDSSTPPPLLTNADPNNANNITLSSSRLQSESPDNCHTSHNQRSRYEQNSSPDVDSSKSFSVSQRSSEEAGNNSESSPPPPDYSPENLSSRKYANATHPLSLHHSQNNNSIGLEHKLPLSFLGPPLAALHSMTEMKSATGGGNSLNGTFSGVNQNSHIISNESRQSNTATTNNSTNLNTQTQPGAANPHGIDTILSKPPPVTSAASLSALAGGGIPRFSIAAAAAGMAQYLSQSQATPLKTHPGHMVERTHLYWPGLQGLVANPMAWRERLSNTRKTSHLLLMIVIKQRMDRMHVDIIN